MRPVYTLGLRRWMPGLEDAHGNPVESWADPVDWKVFAVAPTASMEPLADRMAVATGISVLAPPDPLPGPHDVVIYDGEEWQVVGEVANYTTGPFTYKPGVVVNLERKEG